MECITRLDGAALAAVERGGAARVAQAWAEGMQRAKGERVTRWGLQGRDEGRGCVHELQGRHAGYWMCHLARTFRHAPRSPMARGHDRHPRCPPAHSLGLWHPACAGGCDPGAPPRAGGGGGGRGVVVFATCGRARGNGPASATHRGVRRAVRHADGIKHKVFAGMGGNRDSIAVHRQAPHRTMQTLICLPSSPQRWRRPCSPRGGGGRRPPQRRLRGTDGVDDACE